MMKTELTLLLIALSFASQICGATKVYESGHEYVDMGLSVMWATCNIGATKPEESGGKYRWAETEIYTKNPSNFYYSKYLDKKSTTSSGPYTKYSNDPKNSDNDYKFLLDDEDDAAVVNWGGKWRMPTEAEMSELKENCTWTWTTQNGVEGFLVKSKINGNTIFLPAAGDTSGTRTGLIGGYYLSSELCDTQYPYVLRFSKSDDTPEAFVSSYAYRYEGYSVRAVFNLLPKTLRAIHKGHECVDLGLTVKWATCNVGASSPEGSGGYYAWGETVGNKTDYSRSTYKWWKGGVVTKYETDLNIFGALLAGAGNNTQYFLDVEDRPVWNGWAMPAEKHMNELIYNCEWTFTSKNGVKGFNIKSKKNGESIFLPACGFRKDKSLLFKGENCMYWTDERTKKSENEAYFLQGNEDITFVDGMGREYGLPIRPIYYGILNNNTNSNSTNKNSQTTNKTTSVQPRKKTTAPIISKNEILTLKDHVFGFVNTPPSQCTISSVNNEMLRKYGFKLKRTGKYLFWNDTDIPVGFNYLLGGKKIDTAVFCQNKKYKSWSYSIYEQTISSTFDEEVDFIKQLQRELETEGYMFTIMKDNNQKYEIISINKDIRINISCSKTDYSSFININFLTK